MTNNWAFIGKILSYEKSSREIHIDIGFGLGKWFVKFLLKFGAGSSRQWWWCVRPASHRKKLKTDFTTTCDIMTTQTANLTLNRIHHPDQARSSKV